MNGRAELVAVVVAAEAVEAQLDAFPNGVEFVSDNLAVCDACRAISLGASLKITMAHYIDHRPGFCYIQWAPIHAGEGDDDEDITPDQRLLAAEAGSLAGWGAVKNCPPLEVLSSAKVRAEIVRLLRSLLVFVPIARKKLEDARELLRSLPPSARSFPFLLAGMC